VIAAGVLLAQRSVCMSKRMEKINCSVLSKGLLEEPDFLGKKKNSEMAKVSMESSVSDTGKGTDVKIKGQNNADLVFNMKLIIYRNVFLQNKYFAEYSAFKIWNITARHS
jgi:hypothetical protein